MPKKAPEIRADGFSLQTVGVKLRARAFRQASGITVKGAVEIFGGNNDVISRLENPHRFFEANRFFDAALFYEGMTHEYLFLADLASLEPALSHRVRAILETGGTVQDWDVDEVFRKAGLNPI